MSNIITAITIKSMAREMVRNARPRTDYGELLGIAKSDSPELRALKLEKSKLETKALKAFPSSPIQKEINSEIDKLRQRIKELEEKEKRAANK